MRPDAILADAHIQHHAGNTLDWRVGGRPQAHDIADAWGEIKRSRVPAKEELSWMIDPGIPIVDHSRRRRRGFPGSGNLRRDFSKCWHVTAHIQASVCVATDERLSNVDNSW